MDIDQIKAKLKKITYWYHKIELAPGVITPGFDLDELWDHVRKVRDQVDYKGKRVLDIAAFDGMFTFEAEKKGAELVVAADCLYRSFSNFLFCREVLGSGAIPYYNISPYNLSKRLDVFLEENYDGEIKNKRKFDIVQHFGLLYHLRDPMYSISQARSVLHAGGKLIIETDIVMDSDESFLLSNGNPNFTRVRDNYSVWWAPTKRCLFDMLEASMFEVDESSYSEIYFDVPSKKEGKLSTSKGGNLKAEQKNYRVGRGAVVAKALELGTSNEKFETEVCRTYRNPGLDLLRLEWTK